MSTEADRKEFGMTDKGMVVVIHKQEFDDLARPIDLYEVRHGVRTLVERVSKAQAEAVAHALVYNLPPPPSAPRVSSRARA